MHWASLIFGAVAIIAIVGVAVEQIKAPAGEGPLVGMSWGDGLIALVFFAPILVAFAQSLQYVLT